MKYQIRALFLFLAVAGLYANLTVWHFWFLGVAALILFFWATNPGWRLVLEKFFHFESSQRTAWLAVFLNLNLVGWLLGAVLLFGRLTAATIAAIFLLAGLISFLIEFWARRARHDEAEPAEADPLAPVEGKRWPTYFLTLAFFVFYAAGFWLLFRQSSADALLTPWQAIDAGYIYFFFFSVLVLGALILTRARVGWLLVLLILESFLLHAYLPASHHLIYGADGWRHIASQAAVAEQGIYAPKIYSAEPSLIEKLNPGRFSYAQFLGLTVVGGQALALDWLPLNAWLQPILWSIFFTLILFEIGLALGWGRRRSLFLVWLGLWPFALAAAGAFTLPVNLGLLFWLFALLLILKRLRRARPEQGWILAGLGLLSVFSYLLYFVLFWLGWAAAEGAKRLARDKGLWRLAGFIGLILIVAAVIPLLELAAGYSQWPLSFDWLLSLKQFFGNLTGWYLASGPRPHLILTGNLFFYQAPAYAFVKNLFTERLWWIFGLMILEWFGMIYGWLKFCRREKAGEWWLAILSVGLLFGYFISRYCLVGENILGRRLDGVLAALLLVLFFAALANWLTNRRLAVLLVIIFSLQTAAAYSLGPFSRTVSTDEYAAAVWLAEKTSGQKNVCVVAETYPLLALEALSAKRVVGGGFPIDSLFGQPELSALYEKFSVDPNFGGWAEAKRLTGAEKCFLLLPAEKFKAAGLNGKIKTFGSVGVLEN